MSLFQRHALIIVPTQSRHVKYFHQVASLLKNLVYSKAEIVKVKSPLFNVPLSSDRLDTVIVVGHGGAQDGPIMEEIGKSPNVRDTQPWAFRDDTQKYPDGVSIAVNGGSKFWGAIRGKIKPGGKIILACCSQAKANYHDKVAKTSGHPTYGPRTTFAAANWNRVKAHVLAIERGKLKSPMKKSSK